jgi:hypothetical protein
MSFMTVNADKVSDYLQLAALNLTLAIAEVQWGTSFAKCSDNDIAKATRRQL